MREHGTFHLKLIGDIVHMYPKGGFNEQGIKAYHDQLLSIAPTDRAWALIEHPKDQAGLTPEAAEALCKLYCEVSELGCRVIGLEINNFWAQTIQNLIKDRVDIPVYFNEDLVEVEKLVNQHI